MWGLTIIGQLWYNSNEGVLSGNNRARVRFTWSLVCRGPHSWRTDPVSDELHQEVTVLIHKIRSNWMRHLLSRGKPVVGGVLLLQQDIDRWIELPSLGEEWKDDSHWADEILGVVSEWLA